jgi:phage terminase large subunit-like protein
MAQYDRYYKFIQFFPFDLLPWEKFVFLLHNCVYRPDGLLRWPVLFCLLGRGAGKNGYASYETFCLLTPVNGIKNYDIDIFAMSEDQAKTSFQDVYDVLEDHKGTLSKYFKWNLEVIANRATGSRLRYRTSGVKTKDGGRPG